MQQGAGLEMLSNLMSGSIIAGRESYSAEPGYVGFSSAAAHAEPEAPHSSAFTVYNLRLHVDMPGATLRAEDSRPKAYLR